MRWWQFKDKSLNGEKGAKDLEEIWGMMSTSVVGVYRARVWKESRDWRGLFTLARASFSFLCSDPRRGPRKKIAGRFSAQLIRTVRISPDA